MQFRLLFAVAASFVSAASFWMFLPLLSVSLRAEGISDGEVGLLSGLPWLGLLAVSGAIPRLMHRLGLQRTVLAGMALAIAAYLGFAVTRGLTVWIGLCLGLGVSLGLRWAGMDTWINSAVPEHLRGRLIGAYELIMAGSMAVGPAMLSVTGSSGARPFLAAALAVVLAMALLLAAGRKTEPASEAPGAVRSREVLREEMASFIGIGLVGLTEACNLSLLPVMGLGLGFNLHRAALLVVACQSAVAMGAFLCGALADHLNRLTLKLVAVVAMAVLPLLLPALARGPAVWAALALWGLAQGGLFTVGVVKLGSRFSGTALARALSLAMAIYTLGGVFGPPALGALMAAFGPAGLAYGLAGTAMLGVGLIAGWRQAPAFAT